MVHLVHQRRSARDWPENRATELPGRCGYWFGWTLLDQLVGDGPLDTVLDWSLAQASTQLRRALRR